MSAYHDVTLSHKAYRARIDNDGPRGAWWRITGLICNRPPRMTPKLVDALTLIEGRGYMALITYREQCNRTRTGGCQWRPQKWDKGDRHGDHFAICGQPRFGEFLECEAHHIIAQSIWDAEFAADRKSG